MVNSNESKKTLGRRRIEIKKIEKKTSLQVTFTKRRSGLFRKAGELSVLCDAEIAILVQSPAGKMFTFSHPSVEALIHRFQTRDAPPLPVESSLSHCGQVFVWDDGRSEYEEAMRKLEMEKGREESEIGEFWWDEPYEDMELHELEQYLGALEELRKNVSQKVEEKEKLKELQGRDLGSSTSNQELSASACASTSSDLLPLSTDHDDQLTFDYDDLLEFILN